MNIFILFYTLSQQVITQCSSNTNHEQLKGFEVVPVYLSGRIILMIMFVSSLFLFETFSASYTSFLSGETSATPYPHLVTFSYSYWDEKTILWPHWAGGNWF